MTASDNKLETRLNALLDVYPGFTRSAISILETCGLVDEILQLLDETPDATTETVIAYEWLRRGLVDRYDGAGMKAPVPFDWLALTAGMRGILAEMKGKTFKSYQLALADNGGMRADCSARLNFGQYAVDLICCDFAFDLGGILADLGAMHCEKMGLHDDFRADPDLPVRAYAVGERITGVELVTDRVKAEVGGEPCGFDIDVAVAVRTAHAVYTFSRESWCSTEICISVADDIVIPHEVGECDAGWLGASSEDGIAIAKVTRKTTRLA